LSEDFKVKQEKLQSFIVNGEQLTNEQLCFYKPELTFDEFLQLDSNDDFNYLPMPFQIFIGYNTPDEGVNSNIMKRITISYTYKP
jgi:hypothetical protein